MDLLTAARARQADLIEAIRSLVEIESPSSDPDACRACVDAASGLMESWLGSSGRVEEHGGRPLLRWGPDRPRVLLLGHLDTVWPHGTLERIPWGIEIAKRDGSADPTEIEIAKRDGSADPTEIEIAKRDGSADPTAIHSDRLRGPGVFDMKAGVVQAIGAASLLDLAPDDGVGILLTTDEEIGSETSRSVIEESARDAEAVLVFEAAIDGQLKTARKGTSWYVIEIGGRAAHAGLDPERGINALVEAAALVAAAVTWADPQAGTTVTPTTARAGVTENTVPDRAVVGIDVRAWSADEQQRIDDLMRGWRPSHPEATAAIIAGGINRPAMEQSAGEGLARLAERCAAQLGLPPLGSRAVGGASDGNFTAAMGIPTLDGLGAVGDGAHADHEWASAQAIPERTALVASLIQALLAGDRA